MNKITLILISTLLWSSCGQPKEKDRHQTHNKKQEKAVITEPDDHQLQLNNGEKWIANKETTEGVQNMIELMNGFKDKENVEAYKELTEGIKDEFTTIFQKCTMKGEAHNQLHNFLIPINHLFEDLSSSDLTSCQKAYKELNEHLASYFDYFQ